MIKYGFLLWQVKLECGWAVCVGVWRALLVPLLLVTDGTDHQRSNISLLLLALPLSPVCPLPHTVWLVLPRSKKRHFLPSCPHPSSCTQTHTAGQNRSCLSLSMYRFLFFFFIAPFSLSPTSRPLCFSCFCFFFCFFPYPLPCSVTLVSPYSHVYAVETGDPPRWGNGPDLPSAWHVCLLRLQCRNVPLPLVLWGWVSVVCQLEMTHSSCLGQKWICRDVSVCFACAVDPDGLHLAIQNKKEEVEIKYQVLCWVSTVLAVLQIKRHLCI